jgi:hypothetical protein
VYLSYWDIVFWRVVVLRVHPNQTTHHALFPVRD